MSTANSVTLFGKSVGREALREFKRHYEKAVEQKQDVFVYDGQEVFVPFARYLLQYAEKELGTL